MVLRGPVFDKFAVLGGLFYLVLQYYSPALSQSSSFPWIFSFLFFFWVRLNVRVTKSSYIGRGDWIYGSGPAREDRGGVQCFVELENAREMRDERVPCWAILLS